MQFKHFTISIFDNSEENELNKFLRANKIVDFDRRMVEINNSAYWIYCVQYIGTEQKEFSQFGKREKVDYKTILSPDVFARFEKYRTIRKKIADSDSVPAYSVFSDAELSEVAKLEDISEKKLQAVIGIGEKKIEKYGKQFCEMITNELKDEVSSDEIDNRTTNLF